MTVQAKARRARRHDVGLAVVLALAAALGTRALLAAESPRDRADWWIATYGAMDPWVDSRASRAREVFERLAAAADKKGNRLPHLVLVGSEGDPHALALPDGSIVLNRGALDFCYGPPRDPASAEVLARGDLRLAFVFGHELAHLASDDFWRVAAFGAAERFAIPGPASSSVLTLLRPAPRDQRVDELEADTSGALYMAMAGYSPARLLRDDPDFFARWNALVDPQGEYADPSHPTPAQRAAFLPSQLSALVDDLDYFDFGVRLAELGRYEDAVLFLERFQDRFASREVLSNLGYVHYQLGLRALARCDGAPIARFRLAVAVDDETLASRARMRGTASPRCLTAEPVRRELGAARRYLELAVEHDPSYLPAQYLLLALEIVSERAAAAIARAGDTLAMAPGDGVALNGKAVGLYLFGLETGSDATDRALALLADAERDPRRVADAVFNEAVILTERRRTAAARAAWQRYLELAPDGELAALARERLGLADTAPASRARPAPPISPLALGPLTPATQATLRTMERREIVIGALRGAFYRGPTTRALEIGGAIEVVESTAPALLTAAPADGKPLAEVETPRGGLLRFPGYALDFVGRRVRAVVFFVSPQG